MGGVSSFVRVPRTHYALGVFGQSPLPEKIRTILEAARWRLRLLVGRVSSFVPVPRTHYALGVFGQSPLPEKIRTILEAARWRLRLLVGRVSSFVPVPRTHLRVGRIRTVAATGKDPHDLDNTGRSVNVLPETRKTLIIRPRKSTLRLPWNGIRRSGFTDRSAAKHC